MENTPFIAQENLGFFEVLKEALIIPFKNAHFTIFTFLTSLPSFCFMLMHEIFFQQTLIETAKSLSQVPPPLPPEIVVKSIEKVLPNFLFLILFYLGVLHILELISLIAVVDSAAMIYQGDKALNLKDMLQRLIREIRFKEPLITSIYALLLAFLILSGPLSMAINLLIAPPSVCLWVVFGVPLIVLSGKYLEWCSIWNVGIVISVLEEKQGDVALVISSHLSRGNRRRGLMFVLVFFVWKLALRSFCLYLGWYEGGSRIVVIAAQIGLVCFGNIMKWMVFVVYFQDCKKWSRVKRYSIEA